MCHFKWYKILSNCSCLVGFIIWKLRVLIYVSHITYPSHEHIEGSLLNFLFNIPSTLIQSDKTAKWVSFGSPYIQVRAFQQPKYTPRKE